MAHFAQYFKGPMAVFSSYAVAINASAVGLFYYDKQQAIQHKWRVRESTLHITALLGGWVGGMFAMEAFKHKRAKQSFKNTYYVAVGGNIVLLTGFAYLFRKSPHLLPPFLKKYSSSQMIRSQPQTLAQRMEQQQQHLQRHDQFIEQKNIELHQQRKQQRRHHQQQQQQQTNVVDNTASSSFQVQDRPDNGKQRNNRRRNNNKNN
ncbi:hypothetical protein SAMD00019534_087690 [Acytostelium subglobosum LB1]|uniref:hypothetical protein n=1 Tax=Acytostelium subglobosum LB1 TaxID=1410327 RepID=UPI000644E201|nr:hypothetical protein SAMD00019534_087690 [Acytostelium subglobosum LB1]GAM25594.1 hypothetical protein SAMD00019534_087690 [Acytostelium subglobosum LB1]|eukprot:XP_012751580.1 hypothetical protein SAMD00019534_087690 [Acytostelium subglobosum LB1]